MPENEKSATEFRSQSDIDFLVGQNSIKDNQSSRTMPVFPESQKAEEEDEDMDVITKAHLDWSLNKDQNQFSTSTKFLKKVMFKVPLDKLYKLIASCQYNDESDFCPVLVKIVDQKVIEINGGKKYLLQVWDKQG